MHILRSNEHLVSPYLFLPGLARPREIHPLAAALEVIGNPPNYATNSYWQTELGHVVLTYRNFVAAEVCRKLIDSKFPYYKPSRKDKEMKVLVEKESELWCAVWKMLEVMDVRHNLLWQDPGTIFACLVTECALLNPCLLKIGDDSENKTTATGWVREIQPKINMMLQEAEQNPFSGDIELTGIPHPETSRFVDVAIWLGGRSDVFRQELYNKMVFARKSLIAEHRNQKPRRYNIQGRSKQQGRRSDLKK